MPRSRLFGPVVDDGWRWLAVVAAVFALLVVPVSLFAQAELPAPGAGRCWRVDSDRARTVKATVRVPAPDEASRPLGGCAPFEPHKAPLMLRRVNGVVAILEPRDLRVLTAAAMRRAPGLRPDEHAEVLYEVSLCDTTEIRRVQIVLCPDGAMWTQVMSQADPAAPAIDPEPLDREKFFELAEKWPWYGRGFDPPREASETKAEPAAEPYKLPHPYLPSRWILDLDTLGERFLRGRTPRIPPADRVLEIESLMVRLPRDYSARQPAGLLVWISPDEHGTPPAPLHAALDEANIIAIGFDKCGNTRPIANRYQLAIDAVATATRRFHIDPRRVYVSGLSGGGRVASILLACFPDVFTGAVPICGLNCPEIVPMGGGRAVAPAFARPTGKRWDLFRQRRMAPVTGGKDFSQPEIIAAAQVLRTDGAQVKLFEHLDMGHELPTSERFAEALKWVDEPWQQLRKREIDQGERELRAARARAGINEQDSAKPRPLNEAGRTAFVRVIEVAPWTPAAWAAIERLSATAGPQTPSSPDP